MNEVVDECQTEPQGLKILNAVTKHLLAEFDLLTKKHQLMTAVS